MIGLANESFIYINNTKCKALIDTGSMISTISEGMLNELTPPPELKSLDDFSLSISVAGGTTLPYLGYIEASIKVDFVEQDFMIPLSKTPEACTVVTEGLSDDLSDVSVCPRVVNVKGSTCRVPVRIFNMTAKAMVIKPKTHLCSLNEVKVVRHVDVQSAESAVDEEKGSLSDQELSSLGINLESFDVPDDTKLRLKGLVSRYRSIFSQGPTDIGLTDLMEHEIQLSDDIHPWSVFVT
ncbi:unnamed protein product [Mytilus edulis]|uniref:Peptidase A2 domain-containing protein n=1 Tax=Mytilus edulis TaxID=6550 RepID=A0A8S3TEU7_MYTED|nr:unnamed protein product [Mytilus edulis]